MSKVTLQSGKYTYCNVQDLDGGWNYLMSLAHQPPGELWIRAQCDHGIFVELGTTKVAPAPFLRWTLDANDNYRVQLGLIAKAMTAGPNASGNEGRGMKGATFDLPKTLLTLGARIIKDVQRTIQGMGKIDTGELYNSIVATTTDDEGQMSFAHAPRLAVG